MNMVEKVALAIKDVAWKAKEEGYAGKDRAWDEMARAAIEAMREMTPTMYERLQMRTEIGSYICANWAGAYHCMDEYQREMINAALDGR